MKAESHQKTSRCHGFFYFSKFRKVSKRGAEEVTSRPSFRRTRAKKTRKGAENRRGVREGPREASRLVLRRLQVHSQTTFFEGWVFSQFLKGEIVCDLLTEFSSEDAPKTLEVDKKGLGSKRSVTRRHREGLGQFQNDLETGFFESWFKVSL